MRIVQKRLQIHEKIFIVKDIDWSLLCLLLLQYRSLHRYLTVIFCLVYLISFHRERKENGITHHIRRQDLNSANGLWIYVSEKLVFSFSLFGSYKIQKKLAGNNNLQVESAILFRQCYCLLLRAFYMNGSGSLEQGLITWCAPNGRCRCNFFSVAWTFQHILFAG